MSGGSRVGVEIIWEFGSHAPAGGSDQTAHKRSSGHVDEDLCLLTSTYWTVRMRCILHSFIWYQQFTGVLADWNVGLN